MKTSPPIRLAFGALFWRAFLLLAVIFEIALWRHLRPFLLRRKPGVRVAAMILHSPRMIFRAFLIAAVATVILDLYVRLVMRPLMARWYSPRSREETAPLAFSLGWNEPILAEVPARRKVGRRSQPGMLVQTDRRLWFAPYSWDSEPWSIPLDEVESLGRRPAPKRFGSSLLGIPDRLAIRDRSGAETLLILADPGVVLAWLPELAEPPDPGAEAEYEPSPLHLL